MKPRSALVLLLVLLATACATTKNYEAKPQSGTASAGDLPEAERAEYVKGFYASCLVKQRSDPFSKQLKEEQRSEYCQCAADRSAETVMLEEIGAAIRTGSQEPMKPHFESVRRYCGEKLLQKWLPKQ
jgi:hypothetical protein